MIRKYPGTSSIDILDHIKPSLRKALEQIKGLLKRLYFIRIFKLYLCKEQVLYYSIPSLREHNIRNRFYIIVVLYHFVIHCALYSRHNL